MVNERIIKILKMFSKHPARSTGKIQSNLQFLLRPDLTFFNGVVKEKEGR